MERKCGNNSGDDSVANVFDLILTMWIRSTLVVTVHGLISVQENISGIKWVCRTGREIQFQEQ